MAMLSVLKAERLRNAFSLPGGGVGLIQTILHLDVQRTEFPVDEKHLYLNQCLH